MAAPGGDDLSDDDTSSDDEDREDWTSAQWAKKIDTERLKLAKLEAAMTPEMVDAVEASEGSHEILQSDHMIDKWKEMMEVHPVVNKASSLTTPGGEGLVNRHEAKLPGKPPMAATRSER